MSSKALPFTPIIIIGAGRSGTNILRDTLTALDGLETWPCDEINPIWRHGNIRWPDDEIPVSKVSPAISKFIRRQFIKLWESRGRPQFVVEKTCANSLRVPFVSAILPEARYVYLVRNGYDVANSAEKRWRGDFELPKARYFLSKARYTPIRDLPVYGYRFAEARLKINSGHANHLGVWGPRFEGMSDLKEVSLIDMCALQWINCIERADAAFSLMADKVLVEIKYEAFMLEPMQVIQSLLRQVVPEIQVAHSSIEEALSCIRAPSPGKYDVVASQLSPLVRDRMQAVMLGKGYDVGHF